MTAATTATATTASAVVNLVNRSVTAQLLAPADHERVIVAVRSGQPLHEHHGRDGLIPGEQAAWVTRDDPGTLSVGRSVFAEFRGRDDAAINLKGHGIVVDLRGRGSPPPARGSHGSQERHPRS